jgi:hypothetical protein
MAESVSHQDLYQQIGRLEGRMEGVQRDMADVKAAVGDIKESVDQTRGGGKVLIAMLTIGGGTVGAGMMKFLPRLFGG